MESSATATETIHYRALYSDGTASEWRDLAIAPNRMQTAAYPAWSDVKNRGEKDQTKSVMFGNPECSQCIANDSPVDHYGSTMCRCGSSLAAGGTRAHCSCAACF